MPGGGWTSDPEEEGAWQEPHVSVLLMVASVVGDVGGMDLFGRTVACSSQRACVYMRTDGVLVGDP